MGSFRGFCQVTGQWLSGLFGLHLQLVVNLTKCDVTVKDGLGHPGRLLVLLMQRMKSLTHARKVPYH